jgi:nitrile hydratase
MDGIHDLGGREGFGPVPRPDPDEGAFHHDWERRAFGVAMAGAATGISTMDQFRHSMERMEPAHYLSSRYYEHWLTGVATRWVETGQLELAELERRAGGPFPLSRPVAGEDAMAVAGHPRFAVGDRVVVRRVHARGHHRCPGYVQGRTGVVVRLDQKSTYSVRFDASELWGEGHHAVHVDLADSYLDAA